MSAVTESHFLNPRNRDHVFHILFQFLKDKYQIELHEKQVRQILSQCMTELINVYSESPPFPSVDEFNKRTIVRAKEKILLLMRDLTMPPPPPRPSPRADPPRPTDLPHSKMPSRAEPPPRPEPSAKDEEEEPDSFLKKLQNLELQRNASMVQEVTATPKVPSPVVKQKPTQPPPSGTTVLYLPTPTDSAIKTSKPFVVHSGERMWNYFHDRSILSWEGPLPASDSYMQCTSLLISPATHIVSPIIRVAIEGPGGHEGETICTFAHKGRKWDTWQPASKTIGTLRTIPTPWTIRLFDVTGRLLDLGKDGYTIQDAVVLINQNTKWVFHESIPMLTRGMTILCRHADGTIRRHTALHVHESSVEVEGKHTDVVGCVCAVDDLQVTIVFEITKNESTQPHPIGSATPHGNTPVPIASVGNGVVRGSIEASSKGSK